MEYLFREKLSNKVDEAITPEEAEELTCLQAELESWLEEDAPLPTKEIEELLARLRHNGSENKE